MKDSIFDGFKKAVEQEKLGVHGIRVSMANGESKEYRWGENKREPIYSGTKTFTSCAVGLCEQEERFSLNDDLLSYFPEYQTTCAPGAEKIKIKDVLHMVCGHNSFQFSCSDKMEETEDWADLFFKEPMEFEPGKKFVYSNSCSYMLSRLVEKTTGESLSKYLDSRLFQPLEIESPQWDTCSHGHTMGGMGLHLTTEEFSRLGLLFLQGGVYQGKQVMPADYLKRAVTDVFPLPDARYPDPKGYGYHLWVAREENLFRFDGMKGQYCMVCPDKQAVVTVTSNESSGYNRIVSAVYQDVLPRL